MIKFIMLSIFGLAGGMITAAGLFSLITSVGVVNRFAKVTDTVSNIILYENMIMLGATIGNILSLFEIKTGMGSFMCAIFGLLAGVFIGNLAVSLAETIKALPIFIRRVRISSGLAYIVLMLAIGKGIGSIIYFLQLYPK